MKKLPVLLGSAVILIALYAPVHTWLHAHLELLFGFAVGTWLEMFVCLYEKRHEYKG